MSIFLISDLHLKIENPEIVNKFLNFLRYIEFVAADALYILGDLFEIWIGDDDPNPLHHIIATAVKRIVRSGIPCFFIHGNRDLLIGKHFLNESGITLLSEEQVLNIYGRRILIMHGDTLCTNDGKYQYFRNKVRTFWIQTLFLNLPLNIRNRIALKLRNNSVLINNKKSISITDVNPQTVIELMKKYHVRYLIHGHTHAPKIHKLVINNKKVFRIVLGSWCKTFHVVKITPYSIELIHLTL